LTSFPFDALLLQEALGTGTLVVHIQFLILRAAYGVSQSPLISDDNREAAVDVGRAADRSSFRQRASITLFFEESIL
jgi:hypothetical protein